MKFKLTTYLLVMFVGVTAAVAQNDSAEDDKTETKRPSWSAGLPERTQSASLNTPEFKPEIDKDIEMDMSDFGLKTKPQIELDLPINDNIGVKSEEAMAEETAVIEPDPVDPVVTEPVVEQVVEQVAQPVIEEPVEQPVEQPVELPSTQSVAQPNNQPAEPVVEDAVAEQAVVNNEPEPVEVVDSPVQDIQDEVDDTPAQPADTAVENMAAADSQTSQDTEDAVAQPVEQSIASLDTTAAQPINEDLGNAAALENEYNWEILQRAPVDYPVKAAMENLEGWVELEITIDPDGNVIKASPTNYSRKGRVFGRPAVQSINQWQFKPPSELGITSNITRIYKIEFNL